MSLCNCSPNCSSLIIAWTVQEYQRTYTRFCVHLRWAQANKLNSLLCVPVDQGFVGEHEASVGTQQQIIADIRHRRGFCGSPEENTEKGANKIILFYILIFFTLLLTTHHRSQPT